MQTTTEVKSSSLLSHLQKKTKIKKTQIKYNYQTCRSEECQRLLLFLLRSFH